MELYQGLVTLRDGLGLLSVALYFRLEIRSDNTVYAPDVMKTSDEKNRSAREWDHAKSQHNIMDIIARLTQTKTYNGDPRAVYNIKT